MSDLQLFRNQVASLLSSSTNKSNESSPPGVSNYEVATALLGFAQAFVVHTATKQNNAPSNFIPLFETRDEDGLTIMHRLVAIGPSASSAVAYLASHRLCPLTVRSNSGQTPLDLAVATGNRVCAAILDRAVEIRKLTPVEREKRILEMRERTAKACALQRRDLYSSPEIVSDVKSLYNGLDRSV